jgi:dTDP-4-amino-4,6-dideoxygalactose transaminase
MIPVTKTYFPPIEKYHAQLERIWSKGWLTNRGDLVKELESRIEHSLQCSPLLIMNNGTIPIQIALKLLAKGGEVITTPFSYVATTSSILWEGCIPVFADIDENSLTIDVEEIKKKITDKTTCILATHVFGNPCDIEGIEQLAQQHNLSVIYDAAHCFGVNYKGQSVFNFGDVSTCSFHATKVFHTAEGGAFFTKNESIMTSAFQSHNFGHLSATDFALIGINAKISELQAAMGLTMLDEMQAVFQARKKVVEYYNDHLNFSKMKTLALRAGTEWNFSYYPIILESELILEKVLAKLAEVNVFPRRYFYPSLNKLPYIQNQSCPVSESVSTRVLCLPLYAGLKNEELQKIVNTIHQAL